MSTFEQKLAFGKIAESKIALWLRRARGWSILPVYEKEISEGKGPQFYTPGDAIVAPDMLAMKGARVLWIEAKHKSVFSYHRITRQWCTGIDARHYGEYQRVLASQAWDVWVLFLHTRDRSDRRPDEPWPCPVGLFGQSLAYLVDHVHHTHANWANGMVYWAHEQLKPIATLDEVYAASEPINPQPLDTLYTTAAQRPRKH